MLEFRVWRTATRSWWDNPRERLVVVGRSPSLQSEARRHCVSERTSGAGGTLILPAFWRRSLVSLYGGWFVVVVKGDVELGTWTSYSYDAVGRMPILPPGVTQPRNCRSRVDDHICTFQGEETQPCDSNLCFNLPFKSPTVTHFLVWASQCSTRAGDILRTTTMAGQALGIWPNTGQVYLLQLLRLFAPGLNLQMWAGDW
jgi:hypothetical protein